MIPAGTVNLVAREILDTGNGREAAVGQRPLSHHRSPPGKLFPLVGRGGPDPFLFIEGQVFHVLPETNVGFQLKLGHQMVDIAENFLAAREAS